MLNHRLKSSLYRNIYLNDETNQLQLIRKRISPQNILLEQHLSFNKVKSLFYHKRIHEIPTEKGDIRTPLPSINNGVIE